MMGERDPQAPLWSYRVNLEKRVRCDHPLRRINEVLDLGFVGEQVAHTYGRRGNKSVPPEVILRMMRDQSLLDRAKREAASTAAAVDLKRRQHLMERSFADATNCYGFKRARWRGRWKQAIQ